jgi:hypothetical protein
LPLGMPPQSNLLILIANLDKQDKSIVMGKKHTLHNSFATRKSVLLHKIL